VAPSPVTEDYGEPSEYSFVPESSPTSGSEVAALMRWNWKLAFVMSWFLRASVLVGVQEEVLGL